MGWATERMKDRPLKGEILADTGTLQLVSGMTMSVKTTAGKPSKLVFAHRNSQNDADVDAHPFYCPAGSGEFTFTPVASTLNERYVVRVAEDLDDTIQVTLIW